MRLKDIFSLNLNTRGGVKLFNRIANKYNLVKQDREDLIKEIKTQGSSEGVAENASYYKFEFLGDEAVPFLQMIVSSVKGVYYSDEKYYCILPVYIHNSNVDYPFDRVARVKIDWNVEFVNYDFGTDDDGNRIMIHNLREHIDFLCIMLGTSFEELFTMIGLTPCSKEEFYDITKE